jgi:TolB-like protein/tetratricopeptide (TPR) repeat protein
VRPSVPPRLEQVLVRALDAVPADRYASARLFGEALAACPPDDRGEPTTGRSLSRSIRVGAAAVAVVLIMAAGWSVRERLVGKSAVTTVAVLPLTNRSLDPDHAYLAEGLTDALIGDLSGTPGVHVVSRMSAMRFGSMAGMAAAAAAEEALRAPEASAPPAMTGMPGGMAFMDAPGGELDAGAKPMARMATRPLSEIARELGADIVLQGSLAREADSVRVHATLIRAPSLEQVWQASYSRHVRELFDLQRELTTAVVSAVVQGRTRARATAVSADPARVYDPEAHDAFLRGSYFQAHWKLPQAVAALERAVQLDPTHAPAQAALARAFYFKAFFGELSPAIALRGMRRAATAALEQDPLLAEAHAQIALVKMLQDWDWSGAERHFRRALEISPGHAQIRHDYAHFLLGQGRHRESAEQTRQAVALDPVNPMLISCLGWHSLFDARYDEAQHFALEANTMMPDHWAYVVLGWSLLGKGEPGAALAAFREARTLKESAFTLAALGHAFAVAGLEADARAILVLLLQRMEHEYVSPYDIATVHAGLGEADETFKWLRRAAEERSTFIVHLGWDSRFDRVRTDTRFVALAQDELRLPRPQFAAVTAEGRRSM